MDGEWLKHLASALKQGERVVPKDPDAVRRLAAARVEEAIHLLYDEAQDAAMIYNDHAPAGRTINHLQLSEKPNDEVKGFLLLMGRVQIKVEYRRADSHALTATLITVEGFVREATPLFRFEPQVDAFGSLAWCADNSLLLNSELIIKKLFESLAVHALKA